MYNKIINLKSKLASYNNTQKTTTPPIEPKPSENVSHEINLDNSNLAMTMNNNSSSTNLNKGGFNSTQQISNGKTFMSTINELKKKWNDVSNKSKANAISPTLSPLQGKGNNNNLNISTGNVNTFNEVNDPNINRLNEIKNKFSKIKK